MPSQAWGLIIMKWKLKLAAAAVICASIYGTLDPSLKMLRVGPPTAEEADEDTKKAVSSMLKEAEFVSKKLNIPEPFITSHWMMESGFLDKYSRNKALSHKNLGGIMQKGTLRLQDFNDLHDFACSYAAILASNNVQDMDGFWPIVNKLHEGGYYGAQDALSYGRSVRNMLGRIKEIDKSYRDYYNSTPAK